MPKIIQEEHYGSLVWTNTEMDQKRKSECLCLSCDNLDVCRMAYKLRGICADEDMAMMITRCKNYE